MAVDLALERDRFLTAVMFLTRIPVPGSLPYSEELLNRSARYFPLVGALVGLTGAIVYTLALHLFPPGVALALSLVATIWLTGAFHEDGLADTCDGFGGGRDRERVLAIMKDSRLGTYGLLGLGLALVLKFLSLEGLDSSGLVAPALIVGHAWSRMLSTSYLLDMEYARSADDTTAKSKPLATRMLRRDHRIALLTVAPLALLISLWQVVALLIVLVVWRAWFGYVMKKRLGGYTGDLLGAAQQISEVLIYLTLLALTMS